MRKRLYLSLTLLVLGLALVLASCNKPDRLCCLQHDPETDQATYCNNHRDAVLKFVREVPGTADRLVRLSRFEDFYDTIDDCGTVDCIESAIEVDTALVRFKERYQDEHYYAERDTDVTQEQKVKLILCGFKHAIDGERQTLGEGE